MKRVTGILCVALLVLPFGSALADGPYDPGRIYDPPQIHNRRAYPSLVGQHVRLDDGKSWQHGTVRSVRGDSLVLRQKSSGGREVLLALPQSSIRSMQVRTSSKGHGDQGAVVGAVVGMIAGAAIGVYVSQPIFGSSSGSESGSGSAAAVLGGAALGGVVFAGLGGMIGSLIRSDKWEELPLDQMQFSMMSQPGVGPALSMTLRF